MLDAGGDQNYGSQEAPRTVFLRGGWWSASAAKKKGTGYVEEGILAGHYRGRVPRQRGKIWGEGVGQCDVASTFIKGVVVRGDEGRRSRRADCTSSPV